MAKKAVDTAGPRLVGYGRVSTDDQSLDLQVDALRRAGVRDDNIHVEHISGAAKKRPALDNAIKDLRPGDTLVVWRLDRLARNVRDLYARLDAIYAQGAEFKSLTEAFDFQSATGKFVLGILALVADLERQLTIQRTKAGMAAWMARGGRAGRPVVMTPDKIKRAGKLLQSGLTGPTVAARLKVSTGSIYNYWQRDEKSGRWKQVKS